MIAPPIYLMTDATAFDVSYAINPWMKPDVWGADADGHRQAALVSSAALRIALEDSGAAVEIIPAVLGQPDLVFPANAGIVLDGKALVARFRHEERRGEEPHFMAAFERLKARGLLTDVAYIEGCFQEGAGDCIWDGSRGLFWVGSGPRSTAESVDQIAGHFAQQVVHLPLATDRFYHLDTCFCPLNGGEILYYPPALTHEANRRLHDLVPSHMLIEASAEDAAAFCVNAVSINRTVIMARPPLALRDRLSERGYDVLGVDLEPFILSGGGAFCMTLRLDLKSVAGRAAALAGAELVARSVIV